MTKTSFSRWAAALAIGAAFVASGVDATAQGYGRDYSRDHGRRHYEQGRLYEAQDQYSGPRSGRYEDARRGQRERVERRPGMRVVPVVPVPQGGAWRRGQYLPPQYRGYRVPDLGRYRLRPPPPGYDWVTVGPDIYLMQRNSGLVLDVVPGGY
jgi:Ni/Co efflux regulator RcnB